MMNIKNNRQIEAYCKERPPKEHEKELLSIIGKENPGFSGGVLDVGCASGSFIRLMHTKWPDATYTGIDISDELISLAQVRLSGVNAELFTDDAIGFEPQKKFDVIIASGILSCFEDFEPALDRWTSWLSEGGTLYIFGRFNTKNIDTKIFFRNNHISANWERGLIVYSINTVSKYLNAKGFPYKFRRFCLGIEIPENKNPIRTYTVKCKDGSKLIVNGANTIAEQFFLSIKRNK